MDDIVRQFIGPGAWGGHAVVERQPPDLDADAAARFVAVLVETSGGQIVVKREDLRSASTRLLMLIRETEESLVLETRRMSPAPAMANTLLELANLLRQHDEPLWADSCERLAAAAANATTADERSDVGMAVLRLFQSGMGGFQDVVFQGHGNVALDQRRLDSLRTELFEQAHVQL